MRTCVCVVVFKTVCVYLQKKICLQMQFTYLFHCNNSIFVRVYVVFERLEINNHNNKVNN